MDNATGRAACPHAADLIERMCSDHATITTDARFPDGTIFGDWRLTTFIGRGGNGEVYCAEHVTLGTPAAVKVLAEKKNIDRIDREVLVNNGLAKKNDLIAILAKGELTAKVHVIADKFSAKAKAAIEQCGGTAELVNASAAE